MFGQLARGEGRDEDNAGGEQPRRDNGAKNHKIQQEELRLQTPISGVCVPPGSSKSYSKFAQCGFCP